MAHVGWSRHKAKMHKRPTAATACVGLTTRLRWRQHPGVHAPSIVMKSPLPRHLVHGRPSRHQPLHLHLSPLSDAHVTPAATHPTPHFAVPDAGATKCHVLAPRPLHLALPAARVAPREARVATSITCRPLFVFGHPVRVDVPNAIAIGLEFVDEVRKSGNKVGVAEQGWRGGWSIASEARSVRRVTPRRS